jgi:putative DNA primase/helicase
MNAPHIASPEELIALRLQLRSNAFHPVPVIGAHINTNSAGKRPVMKAWETECLNATTEKITNWSRSQRDCTNTGLLCGEIVGVDIDVLDDALSSGLVERASELFGPSPLRRIGRAPKTLLLYRVEQPHKKIATSDLIFGDDVSVNDARAKVEILADGQQFVAFGIHPDTRAPYRWPEKSPLDTVVSDIPLVTFEALNQFIAESEQMLRAAGGRTQREIKNEQARKKQYEARDHAGTIAAALRDGDKPSLEIVSDALINYIPNNMEYDEWIRMGFALYHGLGDGGRDLWQRWSAQSHKNDPDLTARKWPSRPIHSD